MTPVIWALAVGATFFGCLLSTVSGLGGALLLVPLLTFALGAPQAVAVVTPVMLVNNLAKVVMMRAHVERRALLLLMIGAVPGAAVGAFSVGVIPDDWLQRGLGVWLIGYAALAAWQCLKEATAGDASLTARQRFPEAAEGEPGREGFEIRGHCKLIAHGAVSGVMSGALGVGGGIAATGLRDYGLSKQTFVATVGVVSIAMQMTKIPVYVGTNTLPSALLPLAAALAGVAVLSTRMGTRLLAKMSADIFDKILLVVLFALGITMVVR
jgi:uncharacterized membrane protein YfcA